MGNPMAEAPMEGTPILGWDMGCWFPMAFREGVWRLLEGEWGNGTDVCYPSAWLLYPGPPEV